MDRLEYINLCLDHLITFLQPALPFLNCNLNEFHTSNLWDTMLPGKLRQDIEIAPDREALLTDYLKLVSSTTWSNHDPQPIFIFKLIPFDSLNLEQLVNQIRQLSLLNMNVSVLVDQFHLPEMEDWESIKKSCELGERKFDSLMSLKKEHEVKIMSQFVARVVKHITLENEKKIISVNNSANVSNENKLSNIQLNSTEEEIKHLIDLGSGKGYLSCFLTLLYRFNVLAIDSSSMNTQGSKKWTDNVHRIWKNVRKAMNERKYHISSSNMKCVITEKTHFDVKKDINQASGSKEILTTTNETHPCCEQVLLKNLKLLVTDDINLDVGMHLNFGSESKSKTVKDGEINTFKNEITYGVLGLHTCGALGSDSIKLFINSKNAKFLCNVPCCYHLLEEKEYPSEGVAMSESYYKRDFPLSKLLLDKQFNLGAKARMLASHSPHRMARPTVPTEDEHWDIPQSVYYRSLLQVIIKNKLGHTKIEHRLGKKIGSLATSFVHYVRLALIKLALVQQIQITDEEIEAVEEEYHPLKETFFCFYLLRSLFAPLLDGCVILDRLAYLIEQECVQDAYIVQLFDPAISPRCQALVAIKK